MIENDKFDLQYYGSMQQIKIVYEIVLSSAEFDFKNVLQYFLWVCSAILLFQESVIVLMQTFIISRFLYQSPILPHFLLCLPWLLRIYFMLSTHDFYFPECLSSTSSSIYVFSLICVDDVRAEITCCM